MASDTPTSPEAAPPSLMKLLQKCFQEAIVNSDISAGSNPGDNVIGKMVSAKITTANGQKHDVVVKASVPFPKETDATLTKDEELFARLVFALGFFQTELAYYQKIQPELKKLQHGKDFGLPTPKIYLGQDDEENDGFSACIILEDLRPKSFTMADKMKGLTIDEVYMVLQNISRLHAASYVYLHQNKVNINDEKDPLAVHIFGKTIRIGEEAVKMHGDFVRDICSEMYNMAKEMQTISEELYQKIQKFTQDPRENIISTSRKATIENFPVVIHGDLWVNNILFKYDDQNKPVNVSFIDFQQCRYASIFDELHYFLYTSTTVSFRKANLDKCLNFYHAKFHQTLKSLLGENSKDSVATGFTQEVFRNGYRKYLDAAFCYGIMAIPFQVGVGVASASEASNEARDPPKEAIDSDEQLNKFTESTFQGMRMGLIAAARNSPVAQARISELCVEMDQFGVFD